MFIICIAISLIGLFFLFINSLLYLKTIKGKDKAYKAFTSYLVVLFIYETICTVVGILKPNENIFLSHYNFNFQFLLLSLFFYLLIKNRIIKRVILLNLVIVWSLLAIQYYHQPQLYWQFNIPEIVTISLVLIGYSLIYLYQTLGEEKRFYYVSIGIILFYLCGSIIFMSGNLELVFCYQPYIDIWVLNSLFFITFQWLTFKEWKLLQSKID